MSEKQAVVIAGFPGVGKSYICQNEKELKILDSDSSQFSWLEPGKRNPDFPKNYMGHIKENLNKYDVIFVSTHKEVRDALIQNEIKFALVYPHKSLKEEYLERFRQRGSPEDFIKRMDENWDKFLFEISDLAAFPHNLDKVCLWGPNRYLNLRRDIRELKCDEVKTEDKKEWAWSFIVDEMFAGGFESKEDAILEALGEWEDQDDDEKPESVHVGTVEKYVPALNNIKETLCEAAYDEVGEPAETWMDKVNADDLDDHMNECLHKWLKEKKLMPEFGIMDKVEELNVKELQEKYLEKEVKHGG